MKTEYGECRECLEEGELADGLCEGCRGDDDVVCNVCDGDGLEPGGNFYADGGPEACHQCGGDGVA